MPLAMASERAAEPSTPSTRRSAQVTVQLNALRHADFLAQMTYESERRAKIKAKSGRRPSKTKQRLQSDGALLVMDARARLGPNLVPVSKVVNEKIHHVAFDDVHVEATGAVYYRIWAAPRARSRWRHRACARSARRRRRRRAPSSSSRGRAPTPACAAGAGWPPPPGWEWG